MVLLQKPTATAGQVVKDFEYIVAKNPNTLLPYCNDNYDDRFVKGVKLWNGIAVLETTSKKYRAATVGELLPKFQMMDASTGVVLQDGRKWMDIEYAGWDWLGIEPDGSIFRYWELSDVEYDSCLFRLGKVVYDPNDKTNRISKNRGMKTKEQVLKELGRFAEKCPEGKIVCIDNDDAPVVINCVELDEDEEFWRYTMVRDEEGKRDMTVADLMECLTDEIPGDLDSKGEVTDVLIRLEENECLRYLDDSSGSIFFEHTIGEEKVIAFRCGDEAECDSDFYNDVD